MNDQGNPLFDPATDNMPISEESQQVVNNPIADPTGMTDQDQELVNVVVNLVDEKQINLYVPSSLVNEEVYNKLDQAQQGKVDQQAFNMLSTIREIYNYNKSDFTNNSYQFQNMVSKFRLQKEQTEQEIGDVYKF